MVFPPHKKPQENKQKQAEKRQPKPKQKKNSEELPVPKSFPMENGPGPSKLQAADLTWVYKVPDSKCKLFTEEDVVKYHGFKIEDKLDAGSYGVIYNARDRKNAKVVCKAIDLGVADWDSVKMMDVKNELFIMSKVKHLYIIKVHDHFMTVTDTGRRLHIFMALADGGNLAKYIAKRFSEKGSNGSVMTQLPEKDGKSYFAQILCGLAHLHLLGISHRDIKLQNVLLSKCDQSISGDYTLLISDFGLSRVVHHKAGGAVENNTTYCGTPIHMAPEILLYKAYNSFSTDIWALGITVYIIMTNEMPFDFKTMGKAVKDMQSRRWNWPAKMKSPPPSADLKAMTNSLLEPEPTKRISMSDLCTARWIAADYKRAQGLANKSKQ